MPRVRRLGKLLGTNDSREALHMGAQIYINFMSLTRRSGWLQGHISKQAARDANKAEQARLSLLTAAARHLTFTDLFKNGARSEQGSLLRGGDAVPTRDISVVWAADLLRPQLGAITDHDEDEERATAWYDAQHMRLLQSGARFEKATGRKWSKLAMLARPVEEGARTTPALRRFDTDSSGIVTADERKQALDVWQASYDATAIAFMQRTGTSYRVPAGQMPHEDDLLQLAHSDRNRSWMSFLSSYDLAEADAERMATAGKLADAVASQASFVGRILALGPRIVTDEWIDRAINRYSDFLQLARDHPGKALVPTLDIDLIWHVHMLSPLDYRDDCHEILGRLLSHDDQKGALELKHSFDATAERWHAAHGTPYVWHETRKPPQQQQPKKKEESDYIDRGGSYSGCGSCGWGDELFHDGLFHTTSEREEIKEAYQAGAETRESADGVQADDLLSEATALQEPEPWAVDAPRAPGAEDDGTTTPLMEDPWAPSASDAAESSSGSTDNSWSWSSSSDSSSSDGSSSSSSSSHSSWGWGGDSGDSGGDGGGCGGGCGGGGD